MKNQLPLELMHKPSFASEDFLVFPCNEEAVHRLENWTEWPSHSMAVIGPEGAGKSHLGYAWLEKAGARLLRPDFNAADFVEGQNILVDNADSGVFSDKLLFHVYNWTKETGGRLLMTGKVEPTRWNVTLPDLKSRLATLHVTKIGQPDEENLLMILAKLFADRQLQYNPAILTYLCTRMERSFKMASRLAEELDQAGLAKKQAITRNLAKEVLEKLNSCYTDL